MNVFLWAIMSIVATEAPVVETSSIPVTSAKTSDAPSVGTVHVPFEDIGIFDFPDYLIMLPDELFKRWAKARNKMAYRKARQRADEWLVRNPALDTYIQDSDYTSTSDLDQQEGGTSSGAQVGATSSTKYKGRNVQRTFRTRNRWGGGPVVIINPYRGK